MRRAFVLIVFHFCLLSIASAQNTFQVLVTSGNNTLKATGKRIWAGTQLKTTDQVTVVPNGYIGLVHLATGKTLELKKAGTYALSKLVPSSKAKSVSNTYITSLKEEMTKADKQDINTNHRRYSAITGAVARRGSQPPVVIAPSGDIQVFDSYLRINWLADSANLGQTFYVKVINAGDEVVGWFETKSLYMNLDLSNFKKYAADSTNFNIHVSKAASPSSYREIQVSWLAGLQQRTQILSDLERAVSPDDLTAVASLMRAKFFEDKGFLLDAIKHYSLAIESQPTVPTYQNAFLEFMARNKIIYKKDQE